jgi:hypothetical protein
VVGRLVELVEKFRGLDTETKKIVLGIAGIVAVVGPTLYAIGKLTTAISTLTLAMAKNPATAIAIGLLAIATAAYIAIKSVGDLESALLKQAGVSTLTGSEDERKRLNDLKNQLKDEKKILEDRKKLSQHFQTRRNLQVKIDVIQGDISAIDQAIAKSNILAFEIDQLAESAKEAEKKLNDLANGLGGATGEAVHASGSIDALEAQLEGLQTQFTSTGDAIDRVQLDAKIKKLTTEISYLKAVASAGILPLSAPITIERATIAAQRLTTSVGGLRRGFIPLAETPAIISTMTAEMVIAQQFATQFTDSFGAGMANVVLQGENLIDVLKNIGKLVLSSAIQTAFKLLLMGTSGFGVAGGTTGLFGKLFGAVSPVPVPVASVMPSISSIPTAVMGAGTSQMSGSFKLQGTDLIMSVNRSQRQFR